LGERRSPLRRCFGSRRSPPAGATWRANAHSSPWASKPWLRASVLINASSFPSHSSSFILSYGASIYSRPGLRSAK